MRKRHTNSITKGYADERPDCHVFNFHSSFHEGWAAAPPNCEAVKHDGYLEENESQGCHYNHQKFKGALLNSGKNSSGILYTVREGSEGKKVVALVENLADHVYPTDTDKLARKAGKIIDRWAKGKKDQKQAEADMLIRDLFRRMIPKDDTSPTGHYLHESHARALADKMEELVLAAEK